MSASHEAGTIDEPDHRRQLRRAVMASTIGTTIEWYDFLLYSIVTGLVFAKLYFPASDPLIGTMQAYAVFFVGFIARPVGAFIFGHYGDRIGRKAALIATLLLTGVATFAVALMPSYEQIGIWGAIIMIVLRFIQGVGVGGEWGGSVLLSMEWARTNANRGFIASWPQFGAPAGLFLANVAVLVFSAVSGDQFLTWGWRIPSVSASPACQLEGVAGGVNYDRRDRVEFAPASPLEEAGFELPVPPERKAALDRVRRPSVTLPSLQALRQGPRHALGRFDLRSRFRRVHCHQHRDEKHQYGRASALAPRDAKGG